MAIDDQPQKPECTCGALRTRGYCAVHSSPRPSLQQERSLEEQSIIQEVIERSPFKANPTLHAEHVQKKIQEMDMDKKPDATPREWLIAEATEHTDERVLPASFEPFPGWDKSDYIHVIEFSAYDALKVRVAELEQKLHSSEQKHADDVRAYEKHVAELKYYCELLRDGGKMVTLDEMQEREQKLVAENRALLIGMTSIGNCHMGGCEDCKETAIKLLKAHKGGG